MLFLFTIDDSRFTHMKADKKNHARKSRRDIGVVGAFSIGIGGIVGGGIFATLGLAGSQARGATFLSFIVGGLVALLTAYSYVRLSLTYPGEGGTVTFLNRAFGNGLFAGSLNLLLVLSYVIIMALYAGAFASYAGSFLPEAARPAGQQLLAPGIIIVLAIVNLVGPSLVERSATLFNVGKLGILLIFVVAGLLSPALTFSRLGPSSWVSPVEIVGSGMLVFLSYEGFELIANASAHIRKPAKTLPLAFYGSVLFAIVLYVLIVVVVIGHLSFAALAAAQDRSVAAAAETFMGGFGNVLLVIGAILATASAINSDFFGAAKLPQILAEERQMPHRYRREIWGRHPLALFMIAGVSILIIRYVDLHAISAAASTGFLVVFAMVNVGNAKLARQTHSRRWLSVVAAAACFGALGVMILQILGQPNHSRSLWLIAAVMVFPLAYEVIYGQIAARFIPASAR
ncbi:MAG TPA: APC family permease [Pyrinomonadaceae bacterium]|nr:APC family permease [Pyrinomonadaceae bacterium]